MPPETNVRQDEPPARVVPFFPSCPECQGPIRTKKPASYCSARCRAAASRRRRVEEALAKLDRAETGLLAALEIVRDLRAAIVFRGTP
jgi:hypothetical protein